MHREKIKKGLSQARAGMSPVAFQSSQSLSQRPSESQWFREHNKRRAATAAVPSREVNFSKSRAVPP